jgi:AcrR family transcriptional regulator
MAASNKNQGDTSSPAKLIEAAVRLYGLHGLDGISLRQIGKAAGSANNYAVQYHFGSAAGLIRAIMEKHVPQLEAMRERMLEQAERPGQSPDTRTLVDILYRPLVEHVDDEGKPSYARFVLALFNSRTGLDFSTDANRLLAASHRTLDLLYRSHPQIPPSLLRERLRLLTFMFLASIFNRYAPFDGDTMDEALVDNALAMATSALVAPVPAQLRSVSTESGPD